MQTTVEWAYIHFDNKKKYKDMIRHIDIVCIFYTYIQQWNVYV